LPIEAGIRVDIIGVQLEDLLAIVLGPADEIGLRHGLSSSKHEWKFALRPARHFAQGNVPQQIASYLY
jgi:hypothetical protein